MEVGLFEGFLSDSPLGQLVIQKEEIMCEKVIHCLFMGLVSMCIIFIGCGGDDNDDGSDNEWVGTWRLATVNGLDYEAFFASLGSPILTNNWTFHGDGTFDVEIAVTGFPPLKSAGTYSLSGSNFTTTGLSESLDDVEVEGGTWSLTGSSLTLTGDDGTIIVLKKK